MRTLKELIIVSFLAIKKATSKSVPILEEPHRKTVKLHAANLIKLMGYFALLHLRYQH